MATTSNAAMREKTPFYVPIFRKQTTSISSLGLLAGRFFLSGGRGENGADYFAALRAADAGDQAPLRKLWLARLVNA